MALNTADIAIVSQLLDEVLAMAPAEREGWLESLPLEHRRHVDTLRDLLARERRLQSDRPLESMPRLRTDETVAQPDELVGPYRLRHEIGRGGMGSVWLAERADGSFKRQVALKLPRLAWGAGLADRMAREREIGALLEHPAIARLYDAGVDERGRPYLALEYIDGQPLDVWCMNKSLGVPARLRLFVQVVRAVAYAHGRLVVHRDLKPSNVLVSADGQAHLLDFGIAKLLTETAPGEPGLTQQQGPVMTPHYASPEQVAGETITVASDIYSLGVLLYELLTSSLPITAKSSSPHAIEAAILEGVAPAASRRVTDKALAKALRGEIDAILAKAMHRDPGRRYVTADALAQDIERHLNGDTVAARPDGLTYRLRKAARRHWVGVSAATAVTVAVLVGSVVSTVQAQRAERAAERARVVKNFVVDVFKVNARGSPANRDLRQLPVELLLERAASLIEQSFQDQPDLQAELFGVAGNIFADLGASRLALDYAARHSAVLAATNAPPAERAAAALLLGDAQLAEGQVEQAGARSLEATGFSAGLPIVQAQAQLLLAKVRAAQADHPAALALLDRLQRDFGLLPDVLSAQAHILRAQTLGRTRSFEEAHRHYQRGIEMALSAQGAHSPIAIDARLALARSLMLRGGVAEAKVLKEAALSALRATGGAGDIRAAREEANLYWTQFSMGQVPFAEARTAIERNRASIAARGSLVPETVKAYLDMDLGSTLLDGGDVEAAAPLIESSARVLSALDESVISRFEVAGQQGTAALYLGRHAEAESLLRERLRLQRLGGREDHPMGAYDHAFLALNGLMQKQFKEAEATLDAAPDFDKIARSKGWQLKDGHSAPAAVVRRMRVRVHLERGDVKSAWALQLPESTDEDSKFPFDDRVLRGALLCASGHQAPGLAMLEEQISRHAADDHPAHPDLARTRAMAGLCALDLGQRERARELATDAERHLRQQTRVSPYFGEPLQQLQRRLGGTAAVAVRSQRSR